jgi:hypothetical protein
VLLAVSRQLHHCTSSHAAARQLLLLLPPIPAAKAARVESSYMPARDNVSSTGHSSCRGTMAGVRSTCRQPQQHHWLLHAAAAHPRGARHTHPFWIANAAMITSVALPNVAFSNPPNVSLVYMASCSVIMPKR